MAIEGKQNPYVNYVNLQMMLDTNIKRGLYKSGSGRRAESVWKIKLLIRMNFC